MKVDKTLTITIRHATSDSVYTTVKRNDGVAPTMETVSIGINKLDEIGHPYLVDATFCNPSLGLIEVYLASQEDADLFLSAFEEFKNP